MGSCSEVSIPVINFNYKKRIEQNPDLKAIAVSCFGHIEDSKAKLAVVVKNIDRLLSTVHQKEFVQGNVSIKIVPDDLDSGQLKSTMNLIRLQHDRISDQRLSIEWRYRVYNAAIMIAVIIMLAASFGFAVAGEVLAAVLTIKLAVAIKAVETFVNVMLREEERRWEEDDKAIQMMRDGGRLMVSEFNNVRQKANTLNGEIEAGRSKLKEHLEHGEKSEMKETIKRIKRDLKDLKSIVNDYGNNVQEFDTQFSNILLN